MIADCNHGRRLGGVCGPGFTPLVTAGRHTGEILCGDAPVRYMYRFMTSPWRFSSAVHSLVHTAHGVWLAPVSSRTPSSVLSMDM